MGTLAAFVLAATAAAATQTPPHDAAFWRKLAADGYTVPEGASAGDLLLESATLVGSPDPTLRDGVAYGVAQSWILEKKLVEPPVMRRFVAALTPNLAKGVGTKGDDGVLLRSFSALELSLLAARDVKEPYLEPAERKALLDAALAYLAAERDLRGHDPKKGWIHATAHTADLLKFLARNAAVTPAEATRILAAIGDKIRDAGEVFAWGEDERLASAVLALVRRGDVDPTAWHGWLDALAALSAGGWWEAPELDVKKFAALQNGKHLLARAYVLLSAAPDPSPKVVEARSDVLEALKKLP
jgi:hypothetical protein